MDERFTQKRFSVDLSYLYRIPHILSRTPAALHRIVHFVRPCLASKPCELAVAMSNSSVATGVSTASLRFFVPPACGGNHSSSFPHMPRQQLLATPVGANFILGCPLYVRTLRTWPHVQDFDARKLFIFTNGDYPDGICVHPQCTGANQSLKKMAKLLNQHPPPALGATRKSPWSLPGWRDTYAQHAHIVTTNCRPHDSHRLAGALYKPWLDVCSPLPCRKCLAVGKSSSTAGCPTLSPREPRKHTLTFKGTLYFSGDGNQRLMLPMLHNPAMGIVVLGQCRRRGSYPSVIARQCEAWNRTLHEYERNRMPKGADAYCDLLNSTYGLVPDGRSTGSFRFLEVLTSGVVPVVFHPFHDNETPLPYANVIDWSACVETVDSFNIVGSVERIASAQKPTRVARLEACARIYSRHFASKQAEWETLEASLMSTFNYTALSSVHRDAFAP